MKLIILLSISCFCIASVELLKRRFDVPTYVTRRLVHVGTAVVAGLAPFFVTKDQIILVSITFAAMLLVERRYGLLSSIHVFDRDSFGEVFLPLGVAITALFFLPSYVPNFQFGVFVMGISDALAGLVGERFGKHHAILFFRSKKSMEGSIAFFVSSFVLTSLCAPVLGYQVVCIPLLLTCTELVLVYGLDNLLLPLVGAFLMHVFF